MADDSSPLDVASQCQWVLAGGLDVFNPKQMDNKVVQCVNSELGEFAESEKEKTEKPRKHRFKAKGSRWDVVRETGWKSAVNHLI